MGFQQQQLVFAIINIKPMKQTSKKPTSTRDPMLISLKKLSQNIQKMQQKNLSKYSEIKRINPNFEYALYKASIPIFSYENKNREELSIAQECMLKEIDKIMEEQEKLNIQFSRQDVKVKEYEKIVEKELMSNMDHFTFLRKIWKKVGAEAQDQKIDRLIHNVGAIKGHILNLTKRQNIQISSCPQIHQLIVSSPEYRHKVKQNEQLRQQLQKLEQKIPNSNTYSTSLSSIEINNSANDANKLKEQKFKQLQDMIERYRRELQQKKKQIQDLRALLATSGEKNGKTKRFTSPCNKFENNGSLNGNESFQSQVLEAKCVNFNIKVKGNDGLYELTIKKITNQKEDGSNGSISDSKTSSSQQSQSKTKKSLQQILNFLTADQKRITRVNIGKSPSSFPHGDGNKKFTVEEITRAKFISNRQINATKTNDILQN